ESVEYESLLGWMTNDWIDGTVLHWWCMHLFEMARTGYIFDSYNRDKKKTSNGFYLSNTVERAFDNSFKWTMLELHDSTRALRKDELDGWTINAGSKFFQDYCNDD
nr:ulp1 protease family, C-terminal catalytic domain-containing protein [Tanacetum cinerariifolium]